MKYTKLLILPNTKVPNKLPKICDAIIKAQNRANT